MSVCALPPIVRIYEDFDKMSAEELSYCESNKDANKNDIVVIKKVVAEKEYCSSSCDEDSPKCSRGCSSSTAQKDDDKPKRTRKLNDGRKKSSSNLLYKCSKSFAETHQHSCNQKKTAADDVRSRTATSSSSASSSSSRRHLDPHRSPTGGLRKHVLNRRSPSPLSASDMKRMMGFSHGYEQYQRSFLEVPLPRDYGYASSDDLSSEWDSDVPDLDTSQKRVLYLAMKQQSGAPEKLKINKPSSLLTPDENEHIFSLLGRRCQSMATAVVQLYITESPAHSLWIKGNTGIACFIRDSTKRSYFVRIYCLLKNELIWEEEMYDSIYINKSKEYLLDFEGRECLIALNFASETEANQFYKTATNTISNRSKRRQDTNKRRSRRIPPPTPNASTQPEEPAVVLRNAAPPSATMQMSQFSQMSPGSIPSSGIRDKKRGTRKLTKADISMPTDFKHVVHVGWTTQKGFDLNGEEVDNLNHFLERAGVSEQQLNDRETRAFIYDFIQSNNVLDSVKLENSDQSSRHAPPPVPSRLHNGTQRTAPPPPPAISVQQRQPLPPLPKTTPHRGTPPGRPPPMTTSNTSTSAAPIPPPPPPPPPTNKFLSSVFFSFCLSSTYLTLCKMVGT